MILLLRKKESDPFVLDPVVVDKMRATGWRFDFRESHNEIPPSPHPRLVIPAVARKNNTLLVQVWHSQQGDIAKMNHIKLDRLDLGGQGWNDTHHQELSKCFLNHYNIHANMACAPRDLVDQPVAGTFNTPQHPVCHT